jgi:hypothetical protein
MNNDTDGFGPTVTRPHVTAPQPVHNHAEGHDEAGQGAGAHDHDGA